MTYLPHLHLEDLGKSAVVALIIAGGVCVSEAAWIHAKASLAQALIGAAWRREQAGSRSTQPWPWADTRPLAQLTFEGADARTFMILEGSSGRNLAFGPVHDPASVVPGEPGNSVIEGHRDTHFALLRDIQVGATLHVETLANRNVRFIVTDIQIVDSRQARISLHADSPRLTLVTCYPFDAVVPGGPLRLVVTADRIAPPLVHAATGSKWEFAAWGRNLTDRFYLTSAADLQSIGFDYRHRGVPRTYGVDATYRFE